MRESERETVLCMRTHVCVCLCESERETDRKGEKERERERDTDGWRYMLYHVHPDI